MKQLKEFFKNNRVAQVIGIVVMSYVMSYAFMEYGQYAGYFALLPVLSMVSKGILPDWVYFSCIYLMFFGIWVSCLLFLKLVKFENPVLKALGRSCKGNNFKNLLIGALVGFGMNTFCILAALLHGDIHLTFGSIQLVPLLVFIVTIFIQSSAEELIYRGFMYQNLRHCFKNPWIAILGNAVLFSLLHASNPGVTPLALLTIVVFGILFSLMVYYCDSIWMAMATHAAWNFTQNIIFGLPNSGLVPEYSIFKLNEASAVNSFAYDTGFGIEGTVLAIVVLGLTAACLVYFGKKHGVKGTNVWAGTEEKVSAAMPAGAAKQVWAM